MNYTRPPRVGSLVLNRPAIEFHTFDPPIQKPGGNLVWPTETTGMIVTAPVPLIVLAVVPLKRSHRCLILTPMGPTWVNAEDSDELSYVRTDDNS